MKRDFAEEFAKVDRLAGLMEGHISCIGQTKADGVDDISTNIEPIDISVERLRAAAPKL